MTAKEWHKFLLEENVTMRAVDDDGRRELVPESYRLLSLIGLSPDQKSLLFKIVDELLPTKERVSHIIPTTSPTCLLCQDNLTGTYLHCFFNCSLNRESGESLVCQKERCSGKSDGQETIYMKNNDYGKKLFAGTVAIYLDLF